VATRYDKLAANYLAWLRGMDGHLPIHIMGASC
jgi:hypothetical protein